MNNEEISEKLLKERLKKIVSLTFDCAGKEVIVGTQSLHWQKLRNGSSNYVCELSARTRHGTVFDVRESGGQPELVMHRACDRLLRRVRLHSRFANR